MEKPGEASTMKAEERGQLMLAKGIKPSLFLLIPLLNLHGDF
jgi:hypothetical protein